MTSSQKEKQSKEKTTSDPLAGTIDVKGLASLFDVTERWVQNLAKDGVLVKAKGRGVYLLRESIQGYIKFLRQTDGVDEILPGQSRQMNLPLERYRYEKARADREELRVAEMKGQLLQRAHVETAWQDIFGMIRTRLLEVPTAIAPDVYNTETIGQITQILRETMQNVLKAFGEANIEIEGGVTESDSGHQELSSGVDAATGTDGEPMG